MAAESRVCQCPVEVTSFAILQKQQFVSMWIFSNNAHAIAESDAGQVWTSRRFGGQARARYVVVSGPEDIDGRMNVGERLMEHHF